MPTPTEPAPPSSPLAVAVRECRHALAAAAAFSGVVNVLTLTGAFYMLQVYDRVLASHSVPTLVAVTLIALFAYAIMGVLDAVRARLLSRVGERIEAVAGPAVFDLVVRSQREGLARGADAMQPARDLDTVRAFVGGPGPSALFDLPWLPLFLLVAALLHPWLAVLGLVGGGILFSVALWTEWRLRAPGGALSEAMARRNAVLDAALRGSDAMLAMGMRQHLQARYATAHAGALDAHRDAGDVASDSGALARALRHAMQSAVLGTGALLAIWGEMSPGVMIAGSILIARALAPIDVAIGTWRAFLEGRAAWGRLERAWATRGTVPDRLELPPPERRLTVEAASVTLPGHARRTVADVSFALDAGSALAVLGRSGAGKSTLARAIAGIVPPSSGRIALDGAALPHFGDAALGRHVGYLPQDVQLFDGTIAENIARFDPGATAAEVIEAARAAGIHERISAMPDGYETRVGPMGAFVSAGQRQRIGLARALFRQPFLLVLDEPNANLDPEGERAVVRAIMSHRQRNGIAVVIAHRPSLLRAVDRVMVMEDGGIADMGEREAVLGRIGVARPVLQHASVPAAA